MSREIRRRLVALEREVLGRAPRAFPPTGMSLVNGRTNDGNVPTLDQIKSCRGLIVSARVMRPGEHIDTDEPTCTLRDEPPEDIYRELCELAQESDLYDLAHPPAAEARRESVVGAVNAIEETEEPAGADGMKHEHASAPAAPRIITTNEQSRRYPFGLDLSRF